MTRNTGKTLNQRSKNDIDDFGTALKLQQVKLRIIDFYEVYEERIFRFTLG